MRRFLGGIVFTILIFILWMLLLAIRWDYVVHVIYPGEALGEPIWFHDPFGFMSISIVCSLIAFTGTYLIFTIGVSNQEISDGR